MVSAVIYRMALANRPPKLRANASTRCTNTDAFGQEHSGSPRLRKAPLVAGIGLPTGESVVLRAPLVITEGARVSLWATFLKLTQRSSQTCIKLHSSKLWCLYCCMPRLFTDNVDRAG